MALKGLTLLMVLILALAGCATLAERCDTRPCWYDESKGPGVPYYDPNEPNPRKRNYYLGWDPLNPRKTIRIYATSGNLVISPYVYQPGSDSWLTLYRWGIYWPYVLPKYPCPNAYKYPYR
jgi:hypothetical protein